MTAPVQWRYLVLGLGFLALAGVRAAQGAPVWAVVFVVAAAANAWLAWHEAPSVEPDGDRTSPGRTGATPSGVDRIRVDRSLHGYRTSARQWQVLGAVGVLVGGGLLLVEPALAAFAGAAALFALHRARRANRCVATLRRIPVLPPS